MSPSSAIVVAEQPEEQKMEMIRISIKNTANPPPLIAAAGVCESTELVSYNSQASFHIHTMNPTSGSAPTHEGNHG
jgi:hypothetical protein